MDKRQAFLLYNEAKMLRDELGALDPSKADAPGRPGSGITMMVAPYNNLLERARAALTEDAIAFQSISNLGVLQEFSERHPAHFHKQKKAEILIGLGKIMVALEPLALENRSTVSMRATREGVFFSGDYPEPLLLLNDLFAQARISVFIIDRFIGDGQKILSLLATKQEGVRVLILTENFGAAFKTFAQAFDKTFGGLEVRISEAFHDRFVVIDDSDYYAFGASLKDMGGRGFMFCRFEESEVIGQIREKFKDVWSKATVVGL